MDAHCGRKKLSFATLAKIINDFKKLKFLWAWLKNEKKYVFIVLTLIPLISGLQLSLPIILKRTVDEGIIPGDKNILTIGAGCYLAVLLLEYAIRGVQSLLSALTVHTMIRKMRLTLIRHIMKLSASYHDNNMSGALVTRATSDFDSLSESLNQGVLTSIVDIAVLIGAIAGLIWLDWRLALSTLVILPLIIMLISQFSRALKHAMLKARVKLATLNAFAQECLYGHMTIKLLTAEKSTNQRFSKMSVDYRNAQMKSVVIDAIMFALLDGVSSITIGILLWIGITYISPGSELSAGLLVAFIQYIQNIFEPLKMLGNKIAMLQGAFTSIDRIFGILNIEEYVEGNQKIDQLEGKIVFHDVNFRYQNNNPDNPLILNDLNITFKARESSAIVGATGSGKSTIIKLITKLYGKYEGSIKLDDQELKDISGKSLRKFISVVPQEIVIFDGSISFNIGLDRIGVNQEMIEAAAKIVGADNFINKLPGQFDFIVREQGANLSHGQKQLIVFARALSTNPPMVILDEATSSVDPNSEAMIQSAISSMMQNRTLIVIAHRLSTIEECDNILMIKAGSVIEQGSHLQLMAQHGEYFHLNQSNTKSDSI